MSARSSQLTRLEHARMFVTGSSGFIGTNLAQTLVASGATVCLADVRPPRVAELQPWHVDLDISDERRLIREIRRFAPTHVIHLAARTDLHGRELGDYAANTTGLKSVVRALTQTRGIHRVAFASTRLVCAPGYAPRSDDDYAPINLYGESKAIGETIVRAARIAVPWFIVRPTSVWGPWFDHPYRDFFDSVRRGRYCHVSGKSPRKSFSFVGNLVHQLITLLHLEPSDRVVGRTFYVCDYEPLVLRDFAERIRATFNAPPIRTLPFGLLQAGGLAGDVARRIGWREPPLNSLRVKNLVSDMVYDTSELSQLVGPLPFSEQDGLSATAAWMRAASPSPSPSRSVQ
jgi:nucleoside-diphosphate-sugar epimerase